MSLNRHTAHKNIDDCFISFSLSFWWGVLWKTASLVCTDFNREIVSLTSCSFFVAVFLRFFFIFFSSVYCIQFLKCFWTLFKALHIITFSRWAFFFSDRFRYSIALICNDFSLISFDDTIMITVHSVLFVRCNNDDDSGQRQHRMSQ